MKKTIFLLVVLLIVLKGVSYSQSSDYDIKFQIDGLKDTTVFLAYYHLESTYVKDTTQVDNSGFFRFDGNGPLPQGVYFLAIGKPRPTRLFEFVVGEIQSFSLVTSAVDYIKHMKVSGDLDNKLFFENMLFNMDRNMEVEPFVKTIQDSSLAEEKRKAAREQIKLVNDKVEIPRKLTTIFRDKVTTESYFTI